MTKMAPYLHVHLALMHAETNPVKNISRIFVSSLRFDSSFYKVSARMVGRYFMKISLFRRRPSSLPQWRTCVSAAH
jgi:hypothetical protein